VRQRRLTGLIDRLEDEYPVLGEYVPLDTRSRLDHDAPYLLGDLKVGRKSKGAARSRRPAPGTGSAFAYAEDL
jgi:hypothetical protein